MSGSRLKMRRGLASFGTVWHHPSMGGSTLSLANDSFCRAGGVSPILEQTMLLVLNGGGDGCRRVGEGTSTLETMRIVVCECIGRTHSMIGCQTPDNPAALLP
jgi:hypothetical protein